MDNQIKEKFKSLKQKIKDLKNTEDLVGEK